MDQKAIIGSVITAVVTAAVLGIFAWILGVFSAGTDALDKEQIKQVLAEVLVTDAGKTYAQTLSEVNGTLIAIDTKVEIVMGDIDKLEIAVRELAAP